MATLDAASPLGLWNWLFAPRRTTLVTGLPLQACGAQLKAAAQSPGFLAEATVVGRLGDYGGVLERTRGIQSFDWSWSGTQLELRLEETASGTTIHCQCFPSKSSRRVSTILFAAIAAPVLAIFGFTSPLGGALVAWPSLLASFGMLALAAFGARSEGLASRQDETFLLGLVRSTLQARPLALEVR